ncbi:MAG: nitrite/sulfite reductase, partial [Acidobacteria bacterium]|nr:nitrite/sulfite reductase [Acidobacteriota bacterium]
MPPLARRSDVDAFRHALAEFRSGAWAEDRFTAFRLRFGVYGQRQAGVQMVRIKLPGGILPVAWARKMAEVTRRFAKGEAHVTTRQDFQIYYVDLDDAPAMLESLDEVGMTTREACGNSVRNVTGCPYAGVCPDEVFDVTPYARALSL